MTPAAGRLSALAAGAGRGRVALFAFLVAALAIRCWDLNARSLWFDEAGEYWVATAPLSALGESVRTGSGDPPLYAFLLHLWLGLGSSVLWMRALSVVASLIGVAGVMMLSHRLGGRRAAMAAGAMAAVLPADVRYAQEAGQYALMIAAIAWNLAALDRLRTAPGRRAAAAWAVTALVASYSYYGAVFTVAIPFACFAVESSARRDGPRLRALLAALAGYAAGALPLVLYFLPDPLSRVMATGVSTADPQTGRALTAGAAATWLNQVIAFQFSGWPYTRVPAIAPVAGVLLLAGLAARAQARALVWLGATWAVYTLADVAGVFPYGFRWGLILTPLIVAVAACGAASTGRRMVSVSARVALASLLLCSVVSLPNRSLRDTLYGRAAWPWPETEDLRAVLAHWRANRAGTEPTYVYYGAAPAFAYYTREEAWSMDLPPTWFLECWHRGEAAYCGRANVRFGRWLRGLNDAQRVADVFRAFDGRPESLWLVFSHIQPADDRDLVAALVANGYRIESAYQATGAAVFLMRRA